jgi:peptidoglycan/LPS O-acetylase OafA/YrhL
MSGEGNIDSGAAVFAGSAAPAREMFLADMRSQFVRVPSLDGIRAVSILIVMLSHFVASDLFPGGFGVLIFFVVSGFLITRLLFAELKSRRAVSLPNFYLRRFFRLYPVIVAYTLAVLVLFAATRKRIDWWEPLSALFYFANYFYAHAMAVGSARHLMPFSIFWSLSIEEHFYILFPVLFVVLKGRPGRMAVAMTAIIAACIFARLAVAYARPDLLTTHWFYYTELRLDSIAFGVLLASLCESSNGRQLVKRMLKPEAVLGATAILLACFLLRNDWFRETLRYSLQGGCVVVLLAAVLFSPRYRLAQIVLNSFAMSWIGVLSYSLYLWHFFADSLVEDFARVPHATQAIIGFALSFALAIPSYLLLERPLARLRHRFGSHVA